MTFLSQAILRRDTPEACAYARQALEVSKRDAGHRLIWQLFSMSSDDKRTFVYKEADFGEYLIVSETKPSFDPQVWYIRSRDYNPDIRAGQKFGFSIKINPTTDVSQPDRKRSKHVDVMMHARKMAGRKLSMEERERVVLDWFGKRLSKSGAVLQKNMCFMKDYTLINLEHKKPKASLTSVGIEGVLSVQDADLFKQVLVSGIGHGKAFGLGLLLIRPVPCADTDE